MYGYVKNAGDGASWTLIQSLKLAGNKDAEKVAGEFDNIAASDIACLLFGFEVRKVKQGGEELPPLTPTPSVP